jgi:hypothetical protein
VTLALVSRATGARQTMATFSDGEYYLSRVRPGDYDLSVDPAALAALGAAVAGGTLRVNVPADGSEVVQLPEVRLVPGAR